MQHVAFVYCSWRRYYGEIFCLVKDVTKDVAIEIKILALLKENASITTTEMARKLSVNRRTIQRSLDVLKSKGTIERKGGKRYGYWEVYE